MKKIAKNVLSVVLCTALVTALLPQTNYMQEVKAATVTEGDFTIITDGTSGEDYSYEGKVLTILKDTSITIRNTNSDVATTDRIEVAEGVNANITLAGVNIDVSSINSTAAFKIASYSTGNVTITLADGTNNILKSGRSRAGLQKDGYASSGTLTIDGNTGTLTATGGDNGAGIGGAGGGSGSNITISGGSVTATGGDDGAGIGGAGGGSGSDITISGGSVTATGGDDGAGIGGAAGESGSDITISGGCVAANGGSNASHIGGGRFDESGNNITKENSLVIEGNAGIVTGDAAVDNDFTIGEDVTVEIGEDDSLTVEEDVTLTNDGMINNKGIINNSGTINNNWTINNNGTIHNHGTVNGSETIIGAPVEIPEWSEWESGNPDTCEEEVSQKRRCTLCGYEEMQVLPATGHDYGEWQSNGDNTHTKTCANNPLHTITEDCLGGRASYTEKAVCSECHSEYGEVLEDKTAPTGKISIAANEWDSFLDKITFGLYYKATEDVTITAWDDESGVASVSFYLSDKVLSKEEVKEVTDWTEGNPDETTFSISPDRTCVVYVKITDKQDNTTYLSSDGLVFDETAPEITGVTEDAVYCESVTVTVTDDYLDSVTVAGQEVSLSNGQYTLQGADEPQTITAADKAGNSVSVTVTVNKEHSYGDWIQQEAATCEEDGTKTRTCTVCQHVEEESIEKTGHKYGKWQSNGDDTHTKTCENDSSHTITEKCSGGQATGTKKAVCSGCNEEYGSLVDDEPPTEVGTKKTVSNGVYEVTKSSATSKEVTFIKPKNSKKTSITIPATIKIDGQTYKVTEIAAKAFKGNKKIKSVTIGKNVKKIGKEAFFGCKNLKKITIKSTTLKTVGKNAIKGIKAKATIKCPKKQLTKYKKLFKKKTGYKKTMKIK